MPYYKAFNNIKEGNQCDGFIMHPGGEMCFSSYIRAFPDFCMVGRLKFLNGFYNEGSYCDATKIS